jgi:hypothetical protein
VQHEKNSKLDGQVNEGCWVGFDEQSKGHQNFWPGKRSVTVEHSVVFMEALVFVDELEGEDSVGHSTVKPASTATEADLHQDDKPSTPPQRASIPVPKTHTFSVFANLHSMYMIFSLQVLRLALQIAAQC